MNQSIPEINQSSAFVANRKRIGFKIAIFASIVIFLTSLFFLNFFNLLKLYQFPFLPFLPHQPSQNIISEKPVLTPIPITLKCPTITQFCTDAKDVFKNNIYQGMGAMIPSGSSVIAVFDGKVLSRTVFLAPKLGGGQYVQISIFNASTGLTALYFYKGKPPIVSEVKRGDTIIKLTADKIPNFQDYNFMFLVNEKSGSISKSRIIFN